MEEEVTLRGPIRLVSGSCCCHLCGDPLEAVAIAGLVEDDEYQGDALLSYVQSMPEDLLAVIVERFPWYGLVESHTAEMAYYGTQCPRCGAIAGDFYLHDAGGVFGPLDEQGLESLRLEPVSLDGPFALKAEFAEEWWLDRFR